jgi:hypothetical protein
MTRGASSRYRSATEAAEHFPRSAAFSHEQTLGPDGSLTSSMQVVCWSRSFRSGPTRSSAGAREC